jgi:integrase
VKQRRSHPVNALTPAAVRQLKKPGRHADGNGLYLEIDPSGARRWILRVVVHGRRRDIGLGSARTVPLGDARTAAAHMRRLAREGGDPVAERRKAQMVIPTFKDAAKTVHTETLGSWKNEKHAASWLRSLETHAHPVLGNRRVDQIETSDVLKVLSPIWLTKAETARRVRQRIHTVLDWVRVAYSLPGANAVEGVERGLPKQPERNEHFAAMDYAEVPAFFKRLQRRSDEDMAALAFEFLILNASRTNEVLPARREEINFGCEVWTIPAARMKTGVEHIVPLSKRAVAIVKRALELGGEDEELVFPSRKRGKPLSNMVFLMMLRRMKLEVTAHGFRSSFRDWAAEETEFPDFVVEKALAHAIDNKVEAAYRRGDLLKKRRELMSEWAGYCSGKQTLATANDTLQKEPRPKARLNSGRGDTAIRAGDHEGAGPIALKPRSPLTLMRVPDR